MDRIGGKEWSNWLQHYENIVDPYHLLMLHQWISGDQFEGALMQGKPTIGWEKTPLGVRYNLIKDLPNGNRMVRHAECIVPNMFIIPSIREPGTGPKRKERGTEPSWAVPIDNEHVRGISIVAWPRAWNTILSPREAAALPYTQHHTSSFRRVFVTHRQAATGFSLDALARYPMTTRVTFLECGGNSAPLFSPQPLQANVQALHGPASCAEWTGVKLSTLLDEAGIDPKAKWFIAEGADAPHLARSVPLKKGLDDAMIALYQNGERLMPANGYPMRLLLPGYEGNMNVKYLRRIKLVAEPAMSYWEAKIYSPILPSGKAYQFYLLQEVKSFITHPSPGVNLKGPGLYEISGIAYSGADAGRRSAPSTPASLSLRTPTPMASDASSARAGPRWRCSQPA
jgi:hypothetical protein